MPQLLHILTRPPEDLVKTILNEQRNVTTNVVEVVDLASGNPDYAKLVQKVFEADSVSVW